MLVFYTGTCFFVLWLGFCVFCLVCYITYHSYSVTGPHDAHDIFKVMALEVKVADIFRKRTFGQRHTSGWYAIDD